MAYWPGATLKPREPRRTLLADARMRLDDKWADVRIRNASAHGMMVETEAPPQRGSYIEIRRGALIVIGRVAWSRGTRFGLRSQDVIDVDALLSPAQQGSGASCKSGASGERRRDPSRLRHGPDSEARSRHIASALQYAVFGGAAIISAVTAALLVGDVLSRPFQSLSKALGN